MREHTTKTGIKCRWTSFEIVGRMMTIVQNFMNEQVYAIVSKFVERLWTKISRKCNTGCQEHDLYIFGWVATNPSCL